MGPVINNGNVCAVFHTHTPTFYLSSYLARPTGPSEADISLSESYGLPGIVYDYAAKTAKGGMPLNSQARLYTFGVDHRKNPYNENDN